MGVMATSIQDMSRICQGDMSRWKRYRAAGIIPQMENQLRNQILARIERRLKMVDIAAAAASEAAGGPDIIRDMGRKPVLPRLDTLANLAPALRTRPEWLAYGAGPEDATEAQVISDVRAVPVLSWVAASKFADSPHVDDVQDAPKVPIGNLDPGEYMTAAQHSSATCKVPTGLSHSRQTILTKQFRWCRT